MRDLRLWAGQPSLRRLQRLAGTARAANGDEIDALPRSTVSSVLRGRRVPRSEFVAAYVAACLRYRGSGEREIAESVEVWLTVWRRLCAMSPAVSPAMSPAASSAVPSVMAPAAFPAVSTAADESAPGGAWFGRAPSAWTPREQPPSERRPSGRTPGAAVPPQQLPAAPAALVGREFDLAVLDMQLERRGCAVPVVAVSGMPGVGKTALAVHWARQVADHFPDGQIHLDLRGSGRAPMRTEQALAVLLRALGMAEADIPADVESRMGSYRSLLAGRRVLIVLDDALDTAQIRPLLPGDSRCLAVATSRNRLSGLVARDGAHRLLLGPLDPAASRRMLIQAIGRAVDPGGARALDGIARRCMQLPLALRIAGANLADRPDQDIREYAAELERGDRMAALAIDGDESDTVPAAFDGSYRLLSPEAQRLLCTLGLAGRAEFTVESAAVIGGVGGDEARRLLNQIAAENLIEPAARGRYLLRDLTRDYARGRARTEGIGPPPALTSNA
ncbi:NB-ARC domain-containing protein [Streptomyces jumonjinensis]|nr:NB-ARC domain-containing protein [Streptomyces jumonjinensis]